MPEIVLQNELANLKKFDQNLKWFRDHYEELKEHHRGEYVAINNSELVGHHVDSQELIKHLPSVFQ